jgi:hypothetical protein
VPTRKQRRRREKGRRHEWEEVYVDEEGREVAPDEVEELRKHDRRRDVRGRSPAARRGGSARTVEPPSWRRVGRRALIFAPIMFLVIWLLDPEQSVLVRAFSTLQLMVLFVPFSYLVDTFAYRMHRKRVDRVEGGTAARGG